ncbi:MAG: UDP-N-acetylenolpyruvoylglucosamine reductase [Gammaproteobacteria bacterium RIFCSPHIGHO2_12_FULL_42_13]|nr:MAG: UDP-N-acetylenolpyruvoylglucosamine reductase [Gammaproteobacteria bacterium RIFCSPHIGHO2_12_FULL_42_13]
MSIEAFKSLKHLNTFAIDVTARYFSSVPNVETLQQLLQEYQNPFILGGGSNILFTRDVDRLVIHSAIMGIEKIEETPEHIFLKIGAGENWHQLVLYCIDHDYAGIENLSLIPGTVGAAPIQNIGAYGVELKEVLFGVDTLLKEPDKKHYFPQHFSNKQCQFNYRDSVFKHKLKNNCVITHVILRLNKKPIFNIKYEEIRDKLANNELSIKAISDAVIEIRQKKLPNPNKIPNSGSFFKNPIIPEKVYNVLIKEFPTLPHFPAPDHHIKIPAAWLIEQCGFKGKRMGNVGVHVNHALVLVNYGNARGEEVLQLSQAIQSAVKKKFDITLTPEVNIY